MAGSGKADGPTWVLRVGIGLALVAAAQACNEATRPAGGNYESPSRTAALAVVFIVGAFAARAWQAMDRSGGED